MLGAAELLGPPRARSSQSWFPGPQGSVRGGFGAGRPERESQLDLFKPCLMAKEQGLCGRDPGGEVGGPSQLPEAI